MGMIIIVNKWTKIAEECFCFMPLTTFVYDQYHVSVDCQTSFLYCSVVSHMIHESHLVLCIQSSLNIQILWSLNYQVNEIFFSSCWLGEQGFGEDGFQIWNQFSPCSAASLSLSGHIVLKVSLRGVKWPVLPYSFCSLFYGRKVGKRVSMKPMTNIAVCWNEVYAWGDGRSGRDTKPSWRQGKEYGREN